MGVFRRVNIHDRTVLQLRLEGTNLFNMVGLSSPNNTLTSSRFGKSNPQARCGRSSWVRESPSRDRRPRRHSRKVAPARQGRSRLLLDLRALGRI